MRVSVARAVGSEAFPSINPVARSVSNTALFMKLLRLIDSLISGDFGVPEPPPSCLSMAASREARYGTSVGGLVESTKYAVLRLACLYTDLVPGVGVREVMPVRSRPGMALAEEAIPRVANADVDRTSRRLKFCLDNRDGSSISSGMFWSSSFWVACNINGNRWLSWMVRDEHDSCVGAFSPWWLEDAVGCGNVVNAVLSGKIPMNRLLLRLEQTLSIHDFALLGRKRK